MARLSTEVRAALLGLALVGMSCGGGAAKTPGLSFPSEPMSTLTTTNGHFTVAVRSSPQPPIRGDVTFQLVVSDSHGGVPHLQISVQPWMPLMGHGTSVTPEVKEIGDGVYEVSNVYLFMAGLWELRTDLRGEVEDNVAPQFEIY